MRFTHFSESDHDFYFLLQLLFSLNLFCQKSFQTYIPDIQVQYTAWCNHLMTPLTHLIYFMYETKQINTFQKNNNSDIQFNGQRSIMRFKELVKKLREIQINFICCSFQFCISKSPRLAIKHPFYCCLAVETSMSHL